MPTPLRLCVCAFNVGAFRIASLEACSSNARMKTARVHQGALWIRRRSSISGAHGKGVRQEWLFTREIFMRTGAKVADRPGWRANVDANKKKAMIVSVNINWS
jgi:hypothetical protein